MFMCIFYICSILILCSCEDKQSGYRDFFRVAVSPDYPPFVFMQNGEIVGIDIDIIREVSDKLNKSVILVKIPFNEILKAISEGAVDAAISSIACSDERKKLVDFSEPYHTSSFAVLFRKGVISGQSIEELNGRAIGVQSGSVMEEFLASTNQISGFQTVSANNATDLLKFLMTRKIDLILTDAAKAVVVKNANPVLDYMLLPSLIKYELAIALPKESPVKYQINSILDNMEDTEVLEKIKRKWMGDEYIPLYNFNNILDIRGSFVDE